MRFPFFEAFDQPDLHQSCARRAVTVTAPQSLMMLNSELTLELARSWAERLIAKHAGQPAELIREAYRCAYSREATEEEIKLGEAFVGAQGEFGIEAVSDFCHALFNSTEFITVD
jgi:hypothetical protein